MLKKQILINSLFGLLSLFALLFNYGGFTASAPPAMAMHQSMDVPAQKHILILFSYGDGGAGIEIFRDNLLSTLYSAGFRANDLYLEHLDLERHKGEKDYSRNLKNLIIKKHSKHKIDLVITVQQPALHFLLGDGKGIAPEAPVITVQSPKSTEAEAAGRRFLCQLAQFDIRGTLERALEIFPKTQHVLIVSGSSEADKRMADAALKVVESFDGRLKFEFAANLSLQDLKNRASGLPPNSIILFTQYNRDTRGRVTLAYEVEGMLTKVANAPVFGLYDFNLRNGGIGGSVISVKTLGETTGQNALDILGGRLQLTKTVTEETSMAVPMFDWKQIERWGGSVKSLPKGTIFINKPFSIVDEYRWQLFSILGVFIILCMILVYLMLEIRRRKKAEATVRQSEYKYRQLFENITAGFALHEMIYDEQGAPSDYRFIEINPTFERLTGLSASNLLGRTAKEAMPEIEQYWIDTYGRVAKTGEPAAFQNYSKALNKYYDVWAFRPERDQFAVIFTDITEKIKADEALRSALQRLKLSTDSAKLGIWDWDTVNNIMVWDDRMLELYGLTEETFPGGIEAWQNGLHPDDRKETIELCEAALRGEKDWDTDFRVLHPDGAVRQIKANGIVIRDSEGKPIRMLGTNFDITEHRKLEEQLRQSQKMEAIGTLAGGVAHDFNNILQAIIGYGSMAQKKLTDNPTVQNYIQEMLDSADRAAELTRGLLAYSRKQVISPKLIDLNSIVINMEKMLQRIIGEDIEFRTVLSSRDIPIKVDAAQIDQVLLNLVTNARDAMHEGGHLKIETGILDIDKNYAETHLFENTGRFAVLTVSDTGVGIDLKTRANIFEPFFTTKDIGRGTGLGLAMVYGIIKQHDGNINVYSEPGKGTTFRIYLPLAKTASSEKATKTVESIPLGKGETILMAEDDAGVRRIIKLTLEEHGYKVIEAENGKEAVNKFKDNSDKISLLLLDVVMPIKNGRAAYEEIKLMSPNIKALYMSGYTDNVVAKKGILEEGYDFVSKPIIPETLLRRLRDVMDR